MITLATVIENLKKHSSDPENVTAEELGVVVDAIRNVPSPELFATIKTLHPLIQIGIEAARAQAEKGKLGWLQKHAIKAVLVTVIGIIGTGVISAMNSGQDSARPDANAKPVSFDTDRGSNSQGFSELNVPLHGSWVTTPEDTASPWAALFFSESALPHLVLGQAGYDLDIRNRRIFDPGHEGQIGVLTWRRPSGHAIVLNVVLDSQNEFEKEEVIRLRLHPTMSNEAR